MLQPTTRGALLVLAGLPVAVLPTLLPGPWTVVWLGFAGAVAGCFALDALWAPAPRHVHFAVTVPPICYIGDPEVAEIDLTLTGGSTGARFEALADLHADLEPQPAQTVPVPARGRGRLRIPLVARRRGTVAVRTLWLRWSGPLGLVQRRVRHRLNHLLPVTPNTRAVRIMALRFFGSRQVLSGVKVERYLGDGSEFDSLREYQAGFDHRAMDWKASARHRSLLVRDFRAERNHQVVLAVDTGHLMAEPLAGVPRLDHAINGALLLAYTGLKTGDRIGIHAFDAAVNHWLVPAAGVRHFPRVQAGLAGLDYTTRETNFTLGLTDLQTRLSRRSLVVVFTDFVDTVSAQLMVNNVARLARKHVVIFVALRDPMLDTLADAEPAGGDALHAAVVADDWRRERALVLRKLRRMAVHVIDARPDELSVSLLNRYLDIRRRELV